MDHIDRKIVEILQHDCDLPLGNLAAQVGLSTTPCWRRVQRLEADGVIRKRVALMDPVALNVGVTVFVSVKTREHTAGWLEKFAGAVNRMPEVVEFYRMSGDIDYLLRVVVPDIKGYDAFYKELIETIDLTDVSSSFAMEQIKYTTALPLGYVE